MSEILIVPDAEQQKSKRTSYADITTNGSLDNEKSILITNAATVEVCDPTLKTKFLKEYTVYTIRGFDMEGPFKVTRRYKEFSALRKVLVKRWPGIFVPALPPKAVDNKSADFIERRRKFLQDFCVQISLMPHLHYSEEYQIFIRSPRKDVREALEKFKEPCILDTLSRFNDEFPDLDYKTLPEAVDAEIDFFKDGLVRIKDCYEKLHKSNFAVIRTYEDYNTQLILYNGSMKTQYEYRKFPHNHADDGSKIMPSFISIIDYIENEIRQLEAVIKVLDAKKEFDKNRVHLGKKYWGNEWKFKTMFKTVTFGELDSMDNLENMMNKIILFNEINQFKAKKSKSYYKIMSMAHEMKFDKHYHDEECWEAVLKSLQFRKSSIYE